MKKFTLLLICCCWLPAIYAQSGIPTADWQSDLRFLQQTVHQDYSFLFKKTSAEKFDASVEELYKAIPGMQEHEVLAGIGRIVASFQYGHTDISWRRSPVKYQVVPLNIYQFSDGVFIEGAHKDYAQFLGARILKIEGMPIEAALNAVKPLVPVENEQYFKAYGLGMLLIPQALHAQKVTTTLKSKISMTLEQAGKTFEQVFTAVDAYRFPRDYGFAKTEGDWVSARDQSSTPLYLKNLDKIYYFEYLPEQKTVYVRHSQILDDPNETIAEFYARVFDFIEKNDVEKLVLDVRLNGGGNNYKNKPVVTGIIRTQKINQPGKLFVIIGRRTFSACQNLVNELDNYTNATFVGEPTAENINFYGDNRQVLLPKSKTPVFLSFAWWQDKPQWENDDWLAPELAVDMRFKEYQSNQDPVLAAILDPSSSNVVMDPFGHLKSLFMSKQLDKLKVEAQKMVKDPRYRYVNFEDKINQAGYDMLRGNQIEEAVWTMQLNTELFPSSANAWDSLGEATWKAGEKEKAVECYNKAIMLDPDGATGDNSRKMLKEITDGK